MATSPATPTSSRQSFPTPSTSSSLAAVRLGPCWRHNCRLSDRKSTRLNSSHVAISYAVFCLKKKHQHLRLPPPPLAPTQRELSRRGRARPPTAPPPRTRTAAD